MAPSRIQFREQDMLDMIKVLRDSVTQFRNVREKMRANARIIAEGALVGKSGTDLTNAVNLTLCSSLDRLAQKLEERAHYIELELEQLKGVTQSESKKQYGGP